MKVFQSQWTADGGWSVPLGKVEPADLVFLFGSPDRFCNGPTKEIRNAWPAANLFGCSTAGEICGTTVRDDTIVATAVSFEHTTVRAARVSLAEVGDGYAAGRKLAHELNGEGLVHVLVLSDGIHVNGSELAAGFTDHLSPGVLVTGGLSADGTNFKQTFVMAGNEACPEMITAVGLYGSRLTIGCGSLGGWDSFGPERLVTRSAGNVLYELDGRGALDLYKTYLGEHAAGLPATGLLFPLSVRVSADREPVVRTILGVDDAQNSMTFAGDVPEGAYARLMKANFNRLIDGAASAARTCHEALKGSAPDLALLISCVGRKLVLKQRVEDEVEGVRDVLGDNTVYTGFYSYGEISPFNPTSRCELHNQTMTITTFSER